VLYNIKKPSLLQGFFFLFYSFLCKRKPATRLFCYVNERWARLIYLFVTDNNEIYLIHIYDKSDTDSISKKTIIQMLKNAGLS